jgi:hypothetical protein
MCIKPRPRHAACIKTNNHAEGRPWQSAAANVRLCLMDTFNPAPGEGADTPRPETEADRLRRIARESEGIAVAEASLAAGLYVDADDIDAWIDSIGTDHELPPPPGC